MSYTLTTLRSAIQNYTENSETTFNDNLRNFIRSAENRIFKLVDFPEASIPSNTITGFLYIAPY